MASITTARLLLRDAHDGDRVGFIDMLCDPLARAHLGGARSRADAEASLRPGLLKSLTSPEASYVVADRATDSFMGTVSLIRRDPAAPGHIRPEGKELELSYVFLPAFWGKGYAEEATRALLTRTASEHGGDESVLVITQSSERSLACTHEAARLRRGGAVRALERHADLGRRPVESFR
ncbi:GNAT family N-acetyltransferase [Actinopolymorpha rutila]|uniref:RimJ/RimL family protein N-acetyltransferase n=1 Tax=Actinopolymorpha rutila TaxID=446787 RepID=A0A852ZDJ7_9ACTN|nr:GNAT family N-acetyltransferase [Actinopolymorpha rutila]NYH91217.1 RimJ/RimL family protein N-acetyltransferase [Actinopolymorpha rutila]